MTDWDKEKARRGLGGMSHRDELPLLVEWMEREHPKSAGTFWLTALLEMRMDNEQQKRGPRDGH